MNKKFIFAVLFMAFTAMLSALSVSADSKLYIDNIAVSGDISDSGLTSGKTIRDSVTPVQSITLKFRVTNNFTSAENLKIKDIDARLYVKEIDNGDDVRKLFDVFDLNYGDTKSLSYDFTIPTNAKAGTYDIKFTADGKDANGSVRSDSITIKLDVTKKTHNIKINKLSLSSETPECKDTVTVSFTVENDGKVQEKETWIILEAPLIGFKKTYSTITLEKADTYSKTETVQLNGSVTGQVAFLLNTYYDVSRISNVKTATMNVKTCPVTTNTTTTVTPTTTATVTTTTTAATVTPSQSGIISEGIIPKKTFKSSEAYFWTLAVGLLVVVAGIVALILVLVLKGK